MAMYSQTDNSMLVVLALTSHLCTAYVYTSSNAEQLLAYACVWLLGVARTAQLCQQCTEAGEEKKDENMQRWYENRLIRFEVHMAQVMASRVVYRNTVCSLCVS